MSRSWGQLAFNQWNPREKCRAPASSCASAQEKNITPEGDCSLAPDDTFHQTRRALLMWERSPCGERACGKREAMRRLRTEDMRRRGKLEQRPCSDRPRERVLGKRDHARKSTDGAGEEHSQPTSLSWPPFRHTYTQHHKTCNGRPTLRDDACVTHQQQAQSFTVRQLTQARNFANTSEFCRARGCSPRAGENSLRKPRSRWWRSVAQRRLSL